MATPGQPKGGASSWRCELLPSFSVTVPVLCTQKSRMVLSSEAQVSLCGPRGCTSVWLVGEGQSWVERGAWSRQRGASVWDLGV